VRENKFHTHTNKRKIMEDKRLKRMVARIPTFTLLLIYSWTKLWFITVVPKCLNFVTFPNDLLPVSKPWSCHAFWVTNH
jgi:hypothetical protein